MEFSEIHNKISSIVDRLAPLTPKTAADQRLVISSGAALPMDSVVALQLVLAIEEEFGVTFEDGDICPENFGDLASLCRCVKAKLSQ